MKAEIENCERRRKFRLDHVSPIKILQSENDVKYTARMLNYSDNGIYFESDDLIEPGVEIYIGIQTPPEDDDKATLSCFPAIIAWRKELDEDSYFYYGYGAEFTSKEVAESYDSKVKYEENNRRHTRRKYKIPLLFSNNQNVYKGETVDISPTGVFIKTNQKLKIDDDITFILTSTRKGNMVIRGRVVWSNQFGFGLKFCSKNTI